MPALRILLADDHEIVRQGLRSIFAGIRECEIVGEASDGQQAVAMAKKHDPDIVILDISMPSATSLRPMRGATS